MKCDRCGRPEAYHIYREELVSMMGLLAEYRQNIKKYEEWVEPLRDALRDPGRIIWSPAAVKSYEVLVDVLGTLTGLGIE